MFEKPAVVFLYAVSPVHMGAGSTVGVIDNPIQRERHTGHPSFAGSGIKGAMRQAFTRLGGTEDEATLIFGPDSGSSDLHAGAASFGDAQLVAFPVRSLKGGYAYCTCPQAMARARRYASLVGLIAEWKVPAVAAGNCVTGNAGLLTGGKIHLEAFEYASSPDASCPGSPGDFAQWVADGALAKSGNGEAPAAIGGYEYFHGKLASDTVVLSDTDFSYFSENATLVEPHVRINDTTGAADDKGLFYTENLPPESVLVSPLMAGRTRKVGGTAKEAGEVMKSLKDTLDGQVVQLGGDATTGRGLVLVRIVEGQS